MHFMYAIFGGMTLGYIESGSWGLSSYGGAIGVLAAAIVFEKIRPSQGAFVKGVVLSLPLIYSVAKLGCFFAGCCYGIPYEGIFAVTYTFGEQAGVPLFPVQLAETIVFMALFLVCGWMQHHKNLVGITFILMALAKALLDFLRHSHMGKVLSVSQILSIAFIIVGIIVIKKSVKQ